MGLYVCECFGTGFLTDRGERMLQGMERTVGERICDPACDKYFHSDISIPIRLFRRCLCCCSLSAQRWAASQALNLVGTDSEEYKTIRDAKQQSSYDYLAIVL